MPNFERFDRWFATVPMPLQFLLMLAFVTMGPIVALVFGFGLLTILEHFP